MLEQKQEQEQEQKRETFFTHVSAPLGFEVETLVDDRLTHEQRRNHVSLHGVVCNRVAWLWRLPPDDAWDSDGAWLLGLAWVIATPIVAIGSLVGEVPYRHYQARR